MASPKGTYRNPAEKQCWETCQACYRCEAKGSYLRCRNCSGRFDLEGITDPCEDDFCDCRNGVLRWKPERGPLIVTRYKVNPYGGSVKMEEKTQDEKDWESYLSDLREKHDSEHLNPIQIYES